MTSASKTYFGFTAAAILAFALAAPAAQAQTGSAPSAKMAAPAGIPRTADGKPDFTGTYQWPTYLPGA